MRDMTNKQMYEYIIRLKKKGKCNRCGWKKHPEILHLHHKNKKNKLFEFSKLNKYIKFKDILIEIEKCVLLCPNCHLFIHYQELSVEMREK